MSANATSKAALQREVRKLQERLCASQFANEAALTVLIKFVNRETELEKRVAALEAKLGPKELFVHHGETIGAIVRAELATRVSVRAAVQDASRTNELVERLERLEAQLSEQGSAAGGT